MTTKIFGEDDCYKVTRCNSEDDEKKRSRYLGIISEHLEPTNPNRKMVNDIYSGISSTYTIDQLQVNIVKQIWGSTAFQLKLKECLNFIKFSTKTNHVELYSWYKSKGSDLKIPHETLKQYLGHHISIEYGYDASFNAENVLVYLKTFLEWYK